MLLRCLRAELVKFRRSPVWLAFVVLPIFPAILGTMNYLGNLGLLQSEWSVCSSRHCQAQNTPSWAGRKNREANSTCWVQRLYHWLFSTSRLPR